MLVDATSRRQATRWVERVVGAVGALLLAWAAFGWLQAETFQRAGQSAAEAWPSEAQPGGTVVLAAAEKLARGSTIGVLEIPRLRFSEVVAEGDDDRTLKVSIGHLPDTPLPWAVGNTVLAGHRDTHFRALRDLRIGDHLQLRTERGLFAYQVSDKLIVNPRDISVLEPTSRRRLTLVTCYPFSYIGQAPQRFIVIADEVNDGANRATGPRGAKAPDRN